MNGIKDLDVYDGGCALADVRLLTVINQYKFMSGKKLEPVIVRIFPIDCLESLCIIHVGSVNGLNIDGSGENLQIAFFQYDLIVKGYVSHILFGIQNLNGGNVRRDIANVRQRAFISQTDRMPRNELIRAVRRIFPFIGNQRCAVVNLGFINGLQGDRSRENLQITLLQNDLIVKGHVPAVLIGIRDLNGGDGGRNIANVRQRAAIGQADLMPRNELIFSSCRIFPAVGNERRAVVYLGLIDGLQRNRPGKNFEYAVFPRDLVVCERGFRIRADRTHDIKNNRLVFFSGYVDDTDRTVDNQAFFVNQAHRRYNAVARNTVLHAVVDPCAAVRSDGDGARQYRQRAVRNRQLIVVSNVGAVPIDNLYDDLIRRLSCASDFCGILSLCLVSIHKPAHIVRDMAVFLAVIDPRLIIGGHMDRTGLDRQSTERTRDLIVEGNVSARCVTDNKIYDVGVYVGIRFLCP